MGKEIKNKKIKVNEKEFNDCDMLNDILLDFKLLVDNYAISLNEASNEMIYNTYLEIFKNLSCTQQKLFNLAFQKGWYNLAEADKTKIKKSLTKLQKKGENM